MTPTACTHGAVMRNLCFQCSMYDIIDERDALRERVQRLEKEAEAGKQLNRDLLSCLEAGMREEFDISEMIEAVERYEKIVFPIAIQEGER